MTKGEQARSYFYEGYSCAQSMAKAFAEYIPMPENDFIRLCSSFGGGMGRLREVCGAVSVPFMIIGILFGYDTNDTGNAKAEHYARVQEFAKRFESEFGTIICRGLLNRGEGPETPVPDARTREYYDSRPCPAIIEKAADLLDEFIKQQNKSDAADR